MTEGGQERVVLPPGPELDALVAELVMDNPSLQGEPHEKRHWGTLPCHGEHYNPSRASSCLRCGVWAPDKDSCCVVHPPKYSTSIAHAWEVLEVGATSDAQTAKFLQIVEHFAEDCPDGLTPWPLHCLPAARAAHVICLAALGAST